MRVGMTHMPGLFMLGACVARREQGQQRCLGNEHMAAEAHFKTTEMQVTHDHLR